MIIHYDVGEAPYHFDINNYVKFNKKPKWFSELTPFLFGNRTFKEALQNSWDFMFQYGNQRIHTSKTCPGLNVYFSKTIPLKITDDILIETFSNGEFRWLSPDLNVTIEHHSPLEVGRLSNDYIIIKFLFPFYFKFNTNCDLSFTDPVLYNSVPYNVCPGIIQRKKNEIQKINLITLFPKKDAKYHLDKGTVLSCLQFSEKVNDLKHVNMKDEIRKHSYENGLRNNNNEYFKS